MAKEFWYNDNGTWRKTIEFYYNDNGTWRTIKEGWYNDNGTWRQFYTNITGSVSLETVTSRINAALYPSIATARVTLLPNGTHTGIPTMNGNWFSPTTTDIGASYWARITLLSGDALSTNTAPTWTNLITGAQATLSTSGGLEVRESSIRIEISTASDGSSVVATKDIFLNVETYI